MKINLFASNGALIGAFEAEIAHIELDNKSVLELKEPDSGSLEVRPHYAKVLEITVPEPDTVHLRAI